MRVNNGGMTTSEKEWRLDLGNAVQKPSAASNAHSGVISDLAVDYSPHVGAGCLTSHLANDIALELHRHENDLTASRFGHSLHCEATGYFTRRILHGVKYNSRASSCRICIAAGDARMSAAWRMSLAESTSARAAMTLDSPMRFC